MFRRPLAATCFATKQYTLTRCIRLRCGGELNTNLAHIRHTSQPYQQQQTAYAFNYSKHNAQISQWLQLQLSAVIARRNGILGIHVLGITFTRARASHMFPQRRASGFGASAKTNSFIDFSNNGGALIEAK